MSKGAKISLAQAESLAERIKEELAPACVRIEIAGSVRRRKPQVGDIEIVCIPILSGPLNLFGEMADPQPAALTVVLNDLISQGRLGPPILDGPKWKQFLIPSAPGEIKLDLFITTAESWGTIFTIRTGGSVFSRQLVTKQAKGGFLPDDMLFANGRLWRNGKALATPEEADVFRELGLPWLEPENRP